MENDYNNLNASELERLAVLSEELGEVQQVIGKILRHGYERCDHEEGIPNRELLEKELGDIIFAMEFLIINEDVNESNILLHKELKKDTLRKHLHHNTYEIQEVIL